MEKFKTLNNALCRSILRNAVNGCARSVYIRIYNSHECMTAELLERIYELCYEFCPLTEAIFETLPKEVQNYFNIAYQRYLSK